MAEKRPDDLLQQRIKGNDLASFKELYMQHYDSLFNLAVMLVRSRQVAEEIVDDVMLRLWEKRAVLPAIDNLKVYLYVAIKNRSLTYIQQHKKQNHVDLGDLHFNIADLSPSAEEQMISSELLKSVNAVIDHLPVQCKLVFRLVKEDGLKYKEVAEILNISVKTVEYHMGNALKRIAIQVAAFKLPPSQRPAHTVYSN